MPSVSLSLDDAPFGSDLSMRGLTPQAPEALGFSDSWKNPIALEALWAEIAGVPATLIPWKIDR
jgi:hypothetical protein